MEVYHRIALCSPIILYVLLSYLYFAEVPLISNGVPDLQRSHLTAVRLERDGNINIKYRQEVLLGEGEFAKQKDDTPQVLLDAIFNRADVDFNGFLTEDEISKWIQAKIEQHINQAIAENYITFAHIDINPKDGRVTWEEYHKYFMDKLGVKETADTDHSSIHTQLNRKIQETIMFDKAAWGEAVKMFDLADHKQSALSIPEFLSFRHPEASDFAIFKMSADLLEKFDVNYDGEVSEDEFVKRPGFAEEISETQTNERLTEFHTILDENKNGRVDAYELTHYIDPRNPRHGRIEAKFLIESADSNKDGKLSIDEVLSKVDVFIGSKMVDAGNSFHDEF